jgi:UrcA family protein
MSCNALIRTATFGAFTAALLAAASVPAFANARVSVVHFGDLDLSHRTGAAVLYARIRSAADRVCTPLLATDLEAIAVAKRCKQQAIAQAVADVNKPLLWSYHLEQTGQSIGIAQSRSAGKSARAGDGAASPSSQPQSFLVRE